LPTSIYAVGIIWGFFSGQLPTKRGLPIIVGVDYKNGSCNNDGVTDHWIVIVGKNVTTGNDGNMVVQYQYYDPATAFSDRGTSSNNTLTLQKDGTLEGTFSNGHDYTVSCVRPNK